MPLTMNARLRLAAVRVSFGASAVVLMRASQAGSRCASGGATTSVAPVSSGRKNSYTETSKVAGVFCRMRSSVSKP